MLNELKKFANVATGVIDKKVKTPILKTICFKTDKLMASDGKNILVLPVSGNNIEACINFELIKKILKRKPEKIHLEKKLDSFSFEETGKKEVVDVVKIIYDGKTISTNYESVEQFVEIPDNEFAVVGEYEDRLAEILNKQLDFASKDPLKPVLTGIHLKQSGEILNEKLVSCGTNGHILRKYDDLKKLSIASHKMYNFDGTLSAKAIQILRRFAKGNIVISTDHRWYKYDGKLLYDVAWFKIESNDFVLYTKAIEEKYPDINRCIPKEFRFDVSVDRKEMLALVKETNDFANKDSHQWICLMSKNW